MSTLCYCFHCCAAAGMLHRRFLWKTVTHTIVVINWIVKMTRGKPLTAVARKLDRYVRTVQRYLENHAPGQTKVFRRGWRQGIDIDSSTIYAGNLGQPANGFLKTQGLMTCLKHREFGFWKHLESIRVLPKTLSSPKHKEMRVKLTRVYTKLDMKHVLFTNEWQSTIDGPDSWGKGWVFKGDKNHLMLRRQQGGGGLYNDLCWDNW